MVFRADGITNGKDELFIIPFGGPWTSASRISSPMSNAEGDVSSYRISPDGSKVTYIADADTDGINELYVVEDVELLYLPVVIR